VFEDVEVCPDFTKKQRQEETGMQDEARRQAACEEVCGQGDREDEDDEGTGKEPWSGPPPPKGERRTAT
jgi:hypothetical protein